MWFDLCSAFFDMVAHTPIMFGFVATIVSVCIAAGLFTYIFRILDR